MAASGVRIYFSMVRKSDGAYVAGLDLSAGGVIQVAKDAGLYGNRVGAAPTDIGGGDYFYELDTTELGAKASLLKVVLANYYENHEVERIGDPAQVSDVTAVSSKMDRLLGLHGDNSLLDGGAGQAAAVYNSRRLLVQGRLRVFTDAAALAAATAGAADGADGEIYRYTLTGGDTGLGLTSTFARSRSL